MLSIRQKTTASLQGQVTTCEPTTTIHKLQSLRTSSQQDQGAQPSQATQFRHVTSTRCVMSFFPCAKTRQKPFCLGRALALPKLSDTPPCQFNPLSGFTVGELSAPSFSIQTLERKSLQDVSTQRPADLPLRVHMRPDMKPNTKDGRQTRSPSNLRGLDRLAVTWQRAP